jgi:diacylglycerol kinase family enzyme
MVNNQPVIAGNFLIAPETKNSDGTFNVTIFTHKHFADLVAAIYRVRCHIPPHNDPHVISFETSRLRIERMDDPSRPLTFIGDGEVLASSNVLEIGIKPSLLRVFAKETPRAAMSLASS